MALRVWVSNYPDLHRIALCNVNSERLVACAHQFGISETYNSLDEIFRSDLDALAIFTQLGDTSEG
ncbi:MAG: hypothetical protein IMHGJWDQ_000446 [Candidatus Fervidibacter sp.]